VGKLSSPTVELYLFRHGPAEERDPRRWPDDSDRPLSEEGREETRQAARGFAKWVEPLDRILSSPAERARRTAEILSSAWDKGPSVSLISQAAPDAPVPPLFRRLATGARDAETLALVGHEPTLSQLLGYALTGEEGSLVRLSKAGAAAISFPRSVVPGGGRLSWLLTRKQLITLGK
jgi:phosphohistidine phosphatase